MPEIERITDQSNPHHQSARENGVVDPAPGRHDDQQRACRRQQRVQARERNRPVVAKRRTADQRSAGDGRKIGAGSVACLGEVRTVGKMMRGQSADQKLPGSRDRRIERPLAVAKEDQEARDERNRGNADHPGFSQARACEQQGQRPKNVELLLDPERPQMKQRILRHIRIEISNVPELEKVGYKSGAGDHVLAEQREILWHQQQPPERIGDQQDDGQCGKNSTHAPRIKIQQAKLSGLDLRENDAGDEKARDHEEDVDAYEAPRNKSRAGVIGDHQQDRYGAQTVNVRAIEPRVAAGKFHGLVRVRRLLGRGSLGRDLRPLAAGRAKVHMRALPSR